MFGTKPRTMLQRLTGPLCQNFRKIMMVFLHEYFHLKWAFLNSFILQAFSFFCLLLRLKVIILYCTNVILVVMTGGTYAANTLGYSVVMANILKRLGNYVSRYAWLINWLHSNLEAWHHNSVSNPALLLIKAVPYSARYKFLCTRW